MEVVMEKISHIVPASTRQVWVTGEIEKPKRVSEPTLEDRIEFASSHRNDPISAKPSLPGPATVSSVPLRGGKLNTVG